MICSTPAFVLKAYDFRETSKIVVFFSRDFGKVKGVLKGIRKDPRKFSSNLSLLSLNHIVFYKKRMSDIHLVGQCDKMNDFGISDGNLKKFGLASQLVEWVDLLMPLEDANEDVYDLVSDFLNSLDEKNEGSRYIFQIKMLSLSGFKPHFDSCIVCDTRILDRAFFSQGRGGLLCPRCLFHDSQAQAVLPGTIATILYLERSPWASCLRLALMAPIRVQLENILNCFIRFHVGRNLKTEKLLYELLDR